MSSPSDDPILDPARLRALQATGLLDSLPEESLDRLTRLASRLLRTPVALLSLVDADRQFFKSSVGLPEPWRTRRQTPLSHSFCQHVVRRGQPLIVEDARRDPLVAHNGAVEDLGVTAYLGVPLVSSEGLQLGSFCVIDSVPRAWQPEEVETLRDLAASVMSELELTAEKVDLERAKARLSVQHAVAVALSDLATFESGVGRLLEIIGTGLGLDVGEFWKVDEAAGVVRLQPDAWSAGPDGAAFVEASRHYELTRGEGLAGQIWEHRRATWIEDLAEVSHFSRAGLASRHGLHGAIGFPVTGGGGLIGVMTFLTRRRLSFDPDLLTVLATLGEQTGQFAERRRAEALLRESEARTRGIVESSLDSLITIDHTGRVVEFNTAAEATFGYRRDEVLGRRLADLIIPPEMREAHARGIARYLATGVGPVLGQRVELEAVRSDGSRFPVELTPTLVRHDGPPLFTAMLRDITERKRVEADLQASMEAAEAANRSKSEFLANMSHEVRTPMAAVLGYAEMLLDPGLPQAEVDRAVRAIRRNGTHLLGVLDDILDLSKIEAGKLDLEPIPYSPWLVATEVVSSLRVRADERRIAIATAPLGDLPTAVLMDPTRVRQILVNLVSNAVKFSEPGGRVEVRVGARPAGPPGRVELRLEVDDHGIGMSADQLEQIFQPFQQADTSTTRRFGGTGLGLSITRRLVDAMGGSIRVESEPGRGSRFTVRLPLTLANTAGWVSPPELAGHRADAARGEAAAPVRRLAGRVLLVEDSEDNRRVLLYFLARLGVDAVVAPHGLAALEAVVGSSFDLILMDMQMPELDGYGAARALRQFGFRAPIIALTAHSLHEDRDKCLAAGCSDYLAKPVNFEVLAETLGRYLPAASDPGEAPDAPGEPRGAAVRPVDSGDPGLLKLTREYVASLPDQVARFRAALDSGDLASVGRLAHQMKGVGAMYGYPDLTETAALVDDAVNEGQEPALVAELVDELADLAGRIVRGLYAEGTG